MSNKLVIAFILVVLSFVCIAGCTSSNTSSNATPTATPSAGPTVTAAPTRNAADPLIGTWTSSYGSKTLTWTFYTDGSARYDNGTVEFLPPNSWNRLDDTHYNVAGKVITSNLTFDTSHKSFTFAVLPELTFKKA